MTLRAAPPKFPAPSYTLPVPMHASPTILVSAHANADRVYHDRSKDGRAVSILRNTVHKSLDGGKPQLMQEDMGTIDIGCESHFWRVARKSELVITPVLAPGKDGVAIPCHITALDHVPEPERGYIGFNSSTTRRLRLTCEPVARPKRRSDADPWYVFLKLGGATGW